MQVGCVVCAAAGALGRVGAKAKGVSNGDGDGGGRTRRARQGRALAWGRQDRRGGGVTAAVGSGTRRSNDTRPFHARGQPWKPCRRRQMQDL